MNFDKSKITKNFIILILIFFVCNCSKGVTDYIPYVQVQVTISPAEIASSLPVGSAILKNGGYAGLIIYRLGEDQFMAYERLCTYYPNDTAFVVLDKSQTTATCPKCKSSFILTDGSKCNDGPAQLGLRQYQCFYSNGRLSIVN